MRIGKREIGSGRTFIIAEVAQAHDGSLMTAHAFVDAVAGTEADAVKFQCHLGEPRLQKWRIEPKWPQDVNRDAYWKRTGFAIGEWRGLREHADEVGLEFLCSPFSVEAVKLLDPLVPAWKVPSGQATNAALIAAVRATDKPIIASVGMDRGLWEWAEDVLFMQCTSIYPAPPDTLGLCGGDRWGYSDHSGTIYAGLAAVALGYVALEVHVKLSVHDQGFDASSSITIEQLGQLVEGARFIEKAVGPVDVAKREAALKPMRELFLHPNVEMGAYVG